MKGRSWNVFFVVLACCIFSFAICADSAQRLAVKNAAGDANVLIVMDTGEVGINEDSPEYAADVTSDGAWISQLHFSADGNGGGWLTSVIENNFWISSGGVFDDSAGGWIQKAASGKSVFFGSGDAGFSAYMQEGNTNGEPMTNVERVFHILYNGYMAIGRGDPEYPLHMGNGAYCSVGGDWVNGSSREYKQDIKELTSDEALTAVESLKPVTFAYKAEPGEGHVGFIAEDAPDLVATRDRKGMSSMDVVAVLTKVVQEQQKMISELKEKVDRLEKQIEER